MIRHAIPGWSRNGAPHRKNVDTPSLEGVAFATKR